MFNHNRGLWGYTGTAPDGEPLTVQSTGMGGPSAAIVVSELADAGRPAAAAGRHLRRARRSLALGDLLIATEALAADGTSRRSAPAIASIRLPMSSRRCGRRWRCRPRRPRRLHRPLLRRPPARRARWIAAGAVAVEMETATLFALAGTRGLQAGSLLIVSDLMLPSRSRINAGGPPRSRAPHGRDGSPGLGLGPGTDDGLAGRGRGALAQGGLDPCERFLDRRQPCATDFRIPGSRSAVRAGRARPRYPRAAGDTAQPPRQPLEVASRGQVERAHRHFLRADRAFTGFECGG